jgi:hypothetical protein
LSGTLTIEGMAAGLVSGEKVIGPITTTGSSVVGSIIDATLSSGDNTFAVPVGATSVAIFLGQAPSATVKLRTNLNSTDGGLEIAPVAVTQWAKFDLVTGTTSVILNASTTVTGVELQFI